jgi:hypothetical protein
LSLEVKITSPAVRNMCHFHVNGPCTHGCRARRRRSKRSPPESIHSRSSPFTIHHPPTPPCSCHCAHISPYDRPPPRQALFNVEAHAGVSGAQHLGQRRGSTGADRLPSLPPSPSLFYSPPLFLPSSSFLVISFWLLRLVKGDRNGPRVFWIRRANRLLSGSPACLSFDRPAMSSPHFLVDEEEGEGPHTESSFFLAI